MATASEMNMGLAGQIQQVFAFLQQAATADDDKSPIIEAQYVHLLALIQRQNGALQLPEATAALQMLKSQSCFFTAQQNTALRKAISTASSQTPHHVHKTVRVQPALQEFQFIHEYISETQWAEILEFDQTGTVNIKTLDSIIDTVTIVLANIGCLHPSPNPSQKHIVAFIHAVHGKQFSGDRFLKTMKELKEALKYYWSRPVPGAPTGISKYTESSSDFARAHPAAFAASGNPVACKIPYSKVEYCFKRGCCRDTHKSVRNAERSDHRGDMTPASPDCMGFMQHLYHMCSAMQRANGAHGMSMSGTPYLSKRRKMLMDAASSVSSTPSHEDLGRIEDLGEVSSAHDNRKTAHAAAPAHSQQKQLALTNGNDVPVIDDRRKIDDRGGVAGLDAMLQKTRAKFEKAPDDDDDDDDDESEPAPKQKKKVKKAIVAAAGLKKKPAAACKDATAALIQSFEKGNPPKYGTTLPILYNGCRIFCASDRYRVLPFPGQSKYDKGFPFKSGKKPAWTSVLNYCKNPIVPAHSVNAL